MTIQTKTTQSRVVAGATLLVAFVVTTGYAFTQEDVNQGLSIPKAPGEDAPQLEEVAEPEPDDLLLGAVLPEDIPDALSADLFEELGENWEAWSEDAGDLIGELYENKELTDEERRTLLSQLRSKLKTINKCLGDPAYSSIQKPLRSLRNALAPRIELIEGLDEIVSNRVSSLPDGLKTILEDEVLDAIDSLELYLERIDNGAKWGKYAQLSDVQVAVEKGEGSEEAIEFLGKIRDRVDELTDADENQSQFGGRFAFRRLVDTLNNYLLFYEAENADEFIIDQVLGLTTALEEYETTRGRLQAYRIRTRLEVLEELAPGSASKIESLLANRLLRTNLRLAISENLVSTIINQHKNQSGGVADCILGAWVTGSQISHADVSADVVPNGSAAEFRISLNGVARSSTQGRKKPATIFTEGTHYFWGSKGVTFDGTRFKTTDTNLRVDPNNQTVGISTDYDKIPIINGIARKCAAKQVAQKAAEAERIAAYKLAKKVVPEFDREVDGRFNKATRDVNSKLFRRLKQADLYPEESSTSSTDTHILMNSRTMNILELAAGPAPAVALPSSGLAVQVHESIVNNALDRINVAGRRLSEEELVGAVEKLISDVVERPFTFKEPEVEEPEPSDIEDDSQQNDPSLPEMPALPDPDGLPPLLPPVTAGVSLIPAERLMPESFSLMPVSFNLLQDDEEDEEEEEEEEDEVAPATFLFDPVDPIRVKFVENGFTVILRSGLIQEGKREIPLQEITIPIEFELVGGKLVLEPGTSRIRPLKRGRGQALFAAQIRRVLKAKLPRREAKVTFELPLEGKAPIMMGVTRFESSNGWMTVVAEQAPTVGAAYPVQYP